MTKTIPEEVLKKLDYRLNPKLELSESNWKGFRNSEAKRQYPIGTDIQCGQSWVREPDYNNFFRVRKITPAGILVTDALHLDVVAKDCGQQGGWIDYDPGTARLSELEVRFYPWFLSYGYVVRPYDERTDRSAEWDSVCYIDWKGSRDTGLHFIKKLHPDENGLVRAMMGAIL